jgi:hypothetical protein
MTGRVQPYLDTNGTGVYEPTVWLDESKGVQDGTPVDEQNLNNMECGINTANLTSEFLTEVLKHQSDQIGNIAGDIIEVTLTNTAGEAFFNNSAKTVALPVNRDSFDYTVEVEIVTPVDNVGEIIIYDKQVNGFKVKYTGSAASVSLKLYVQGGNAA